MGNQLDLTLKFVEGKPAGVTRVSRDASGNLLGWVENGFVMDLQYNAITGFPQKLIAKANSGRLVQTFSFDATGFFAGSDGDTIQTRMMREIVGPLAVNLSPGQVAATKALVSEYRNPGYTAATSRPVLLSMGDSVNAQDYPDLTTTSQLTPGWNGVSPMGWMNALCWGAFDYIGPVTTPLASTYAGWTTAKDFTNGVWGFPGSTLAVHLGVVDAFIAAAAPYVAGRKAFVMLSGAINNFAAGDTASSAWGVMQQIIAKITAQGWVPLVKCGDIAATHDTPAKVAEALRYRDLVLSQAQALGAVPVDILAARQTYARTNTLDRITRSADKIHPNQAGAVIYGFAYRDALKGRVVFAPPWQMQGFVGTILQANPYLSGTAGSLNASGTQPTGTAPDNTDLQSSGTSCPLVGAQAARDAITGALIDCTGSASNTSADIGLATLSNPTPTTTDVYRAWVDMDVIQADYVKNLSWRVRLDASTYSDIAAPFSADMVAQTADYASAIKLLEGQRVVMSSFPTKYASVVAGSTGQLRRVGGSAGLEASTAAARLRTYTRFASVIKQ